MTTSRKQPLCRAPRVALTRELTVPLCMYLLALQIHGCFLILDEESIIKLMFWNINFSEFGEKKAVSLGKKCLGDPEGACWEEGIFMGESLHPVLVVNFRT